MSISHELDTASTDGGPPVGTALRARARPRRRTVAEYQRMADADRGTGGEGLADFLAYFSIGLGLAELAAPGLVARAIGVDPDDEDSTKVLRLMGVREIAHGVAILGTQHQRSRAMWARVAGDALDLALLGRALMNPRNRRVLSAGAMVDVLMVTVLDVMAARQLSRQPQSATTDAAEEGLVLTRRSITVAKPIDEVYAFWRNLEQLPRFMRHVESVTALDDRRSRWRAKGPAGTHVEWEALITADRPNEVLAWQSVDGPYHAGSVRFRPAPGNRGTEVHLDLEYDPPFGKLGSKVALLFREEPGQQAQDDLRHFKQVMEIGEVLLSDATKQRGMHPARPNDRPVNF